MEPAEYILILNGYVIANDLLEPFTLTEAKKEAKLYTGSSTKNRVQICKLVHIETLAPSKG